MKYISILLLIPNFIFSQIEEKAMATRLSETCCDFYFNFKKQYFTVNKSSPIQAELLTHGIHEWKKSMPIFLDTNKNMITIFTKKDTLLIPKEAWKFADAQFAQYKKMSDTEILTVASDDKTVTFYTNLSWITIALCIVFLGLSAFLMSVLHRMKKQKELAEKQMELDKLQIAQDAERKAYLEKMRSDILEEAERKNKILIDEIHTGPLQKLARFSTELMGVKENSEALRNTVIETKTGLDKVSDEIRRIARQVMPRELEDIGLDSAMKVYIREEIKRMQPHLKIHQHIDAEDLQLSKKNRLMLYRIFQEALNNIDKHAKATEIWITFKMESQILLEIKDNGIGFFTEANIDNTHIGLSGMRARCEEINATLNLVSAPEKGTILTITLNNPAHEIAIG